MIRAASSRHAADAHPLGGYFMALRKWHWFENDRAVCGRKTAGYSARRKDFVTCLACKKVLRDSAQQWHQADVSSAAIDYEKLMNDPVYIELINQH